MNLKNMKIGQTGVNMKKGVVEWFDSLKGIGEAVSDGKKVFLNVLNVDADSFKGKFINLKEGQKIQFEEKSKDGKPFAVKISLASLVTASRTNAEEMAFILFVDKFASEMEELGHMRDIHGELTETVPSYLKSNGLNIDKYLPKKLGSEIEKKANSEWRGKLTLEDLASEFDDAPYLLAMQSVGHGVGLNDEREIEDFLKSKGVSSPKFHIDDSEAYEKAMEAIDDLELEKVEGSMNLKTLKIGQTVVVAKKLSLKDIPKDYPVQPLKDDQKAKDRATCGDCGLSWDDGISTSMTPAPSARCPFEYFHK